jgi:hypothetical protein
LKAASFEPPQKLHNINGSVDNPDDPESGNGNELIQEAEPQFVNFPRSEDTTKIGKLESL